MINLKQNQLNQLTFKDDNEFIAFMRGHLRENYEEMVDAFPADLFNEVAANGIRRARSYKIESYDHLAAFLTLMFEIAPNFDSEPRLADILSQKSQPPDIRFALLFDDSMEEAWQAAEDAYDEESWLTI